MAWSRAVSPLLLLLVLIAVPTATNDYFAYQLGLYLLYGIAAQGIVVAWGRSGFLPLGQALFFGLGAYLSGFVLKAASQHGLFALLLPLAALVPAALAYLIGRLVFARIHASGPYFSLITLALTMLGFEIATQWSGVTGGFNGLGNIPGLPGLGRYTTYYYLIAVVCAASTAVMLWLERTPLGTLWAAISQNEDRLQFFGFATDRMKSLAFGISGLLAGVAGALYAPQQGIVTPQSIGFILSAQLLIWTAVGGRCSPYGALVGTVLIGLLSSALRNRFLYWEVVIAVIFIIVVLRFPGGITGSIESAWDRLASRVMRRHRVRRSLPLATPAPSGHAPAGKPELSYDDVHVVRNGVRILNGLDLTINQPGLHCIIGPNGAGKTSSFNVLTGRLPLTRGKIRFSGIDVSGARADTMAGLGIGRKFQIPSVFPELTISDNLRIGLWANRAHGRALLSMRSRHWSTPLLHQLLQAFPFMAECPEQHAGTVSQGERQMLEFAMTALAEPRLFLLDEPCAGLSPEETLHLTHVIEHTVRTLGASALIVEHDMAAVEALADYVHVLHQGRLLASGSYAQISADPSVQAVYAGGHK